MKKTICHVKKFLIIIMFISFSALFSNAFAVTQNPVALLQSIANKMTTQLKNNQGPLTKKIITKIVTTTLIPYADTRIMGGLVLGRTYWIKATPQQKQLFIKYFTRLVIDTYGSALTTYTPSDRILFRPTRENYQNMNRIVVYSLIKRANGQNIQIQYYLHHLGKSWKVYDFSIDNISLVQSYHQQFQNTLQQGGINLLLNKLKQHLIQ